MYTPARPALGRFVHLDGLRGLAALYVVFHHAWAEVAWTEPGLSPRAGWLERFLGHGSLAVDVFIVLSGFVLMMPVLVSPDRSLCGGLCGFIKRRARRILPAYFAALSVCLALIAFLPMLAHPVASRWSDALPVSAGSVAAHLLLIHNLSRAWVWKIDNPMWSIATEWQIYFVFALVLLPVWKRLGMSAAVCAALLLSAGIVTLAPADSEACFHFIGLFSFGMVAAHIVANRKLRRANWSLISISAFTCAGALIVFAPGFTSQPKILVDLVIGAATAVIITGTASLEVAGQPGFLNRTLTWLPVRKLGEFSYSLYLMHFPLISIGNQLIRSQTVWSAPGRLLAMFLVVTPLTIAACRLFHIAFERPFLRARPLQRFESGEQVRVGSDNMRLAA